MKTREELILDLGTNKNTVIIGSSNSAKSTVMTYALLNSLKENRPSSFLSRDYNLETLTKRLISGYIGRELDYISDKELDYEEKESVMAKFEEFNLNYKESLLLGNIQELSIQKLEKLVPRLKEEIKDLADVYFDFSIRNFDDTYSSEIYNKIELIAKENEVRIILVENVSDFDLFLTEKDYNLSKLNKEMKYVGLKKEDYTNEVNAVIIEDNKLNEARYNVK